MAKVTRAVIYCRVSSGKQVREGNGIVSQEIRCREYAKHHGLEIVEVFRDEGFSGAVVERPGIMQMIAFLKRETKAYVVVIDDISRLARGLEAHLALRAALNKLNCTLESPTVEFAEDADSKLVENLLASVAEHQRGKNAEQVKNRMRARLLNGCWTFSKSMPGYRFHRTTEFGKLLVKDQPVAKTVKQALEGYASGRFQTITDVQRFLARSKDYPKNKRGGVYLERVRDLLTCILYAGYIEYPKWKVPLTKGRHEAIISLEVFENIQRRLQNRGRASQQKDLDKDFPLRGHVLCFSCRKPLTASWSTGRTAKHPYYRCASKGCIRSGKSIRKEKIECDFRLMLVQATPSRAMIKLIEEVVETVWRRKLSEHQAHLAESAETTDSLSEQVRKLVGRLAVCEDEVVATAIEGRIREIGLQRAVRSEAEQKRRTIDTTFAQSLGTVVKFISEPYRLWDTGVYEDQKTVLRLTFASQLTYDKSTGFGTAEFALPFRLSGMFANDNSGVVDTTPEFWNHLMIVFTEWGGILKGRLNRGDLP